MSTPVPADELALAHAAGQGDEAALAALFNRYADPLFAYIYHHSASRADAEDVWQESLLAALRALPSFRGRARLFTWLCSIARHKLVDHLRRGASVPAEVFSELPEGTLAALASDAPLPHEAVAQRATRAAAAQALGLLSREYRVALVARYADECGVDEVARLLGRSYKATESLLSRARAAFRAALLALEDHET